MPWREALDRCSSRLNDAAGATNCWSTRSELLDRNKQETSVGRLVLTFAAGERLAELPPDGVKQHGRRARLFGAPHNRGSLRRHLTYEKRLDYSNQKIEHSVAFGCIFPRGWMGISRVFRVYRRSLAKCTVDALDLDNPLRCLALANVENKAKVSRRHIGCKDESVRARASVEYCVL